jgi:hypothetical protein
MLMSCKKTIVIFSFPLIIHQMKIKVFLDHFSLNECVLIPAVWVQHFIKQNLALFMGLHYMVKISFLIDFFCLKITVVAQSNCKWECCTWNTLLWKAFLCFSETIWIHKETADLRGHEVSFYDFMFLYSFGSEVTLKQEIAKCYNQ